MTPSGIYTLYAVTLLVASVGAFAMAGFEPKAKSALIMGGATSAVMLLCAGVGRSRPLALTAGRLFALLFGGVFLWRAYLIRAVPEKQYLLITFGLLAIASILTFLSAKPVARAPTKQH